MAIAGLIAGLVALAAAVDAPNNCGVDGARYVMRGAPQFTAVFRQVEGAPSAHDLILDVWSGDTGRTYSFTINRGNGYGEATLSPIGGTMPRQVELYTVDEEGIFVDYFGAVEGPAPRLLLAPKLGPALWYDADSLSGEQTAGRVREQMPRAFFDRVACGPA